MIIANRGEIAVRIIRTCRVLGIETILAASEADEESMAARLADRTIIIGPPPTSTYLNVDLMVQAALEMRAQALHPGYGFLSERAELAQACADKGIIFVGPKAEHIEKMGNKLAARMIAIECGVPVVPGSEKIDSYEHARRVADAIGFPVILKAAAGGGGRGMKIVTAEDATSMKQLYDEASAEAAAAFGDGTLYIEKYITHARHIEVQILGDKNGEAVHLGERDCSTQRRHQKLIEEAGAPNISDALRNDICDAAVRLVKSISYENAGTVEFVYDIDEEKYYFLEMNTRIQVEHPVTEMVTGIDIVREQINIASGGGLPFAQGDISFRGHAFECRINAEDPFAGFRPTPGVITGWEMPQGPGVRVDTHCYHGYKVPFFYDSLIAKIIVHGDDREHARRRMVAALDEIVVDGISTTAPFLSEVLTASDFIDGRVHTRILDGLMG
ncbi:MAG: acetyl-CoA carboxylase biotin carboxylase subunit [Oscillospiraceae bacterium]|nr:acetyl-CoA carboxylase biotin carboxylase subunit [Oscillospiraceae bacterium]